MARLIRKAKTKAFLPKTPEIVRAIAMQGVTDPELAFMFGLDPKIIKAWRKMYPSFDKALEEGRTVADVEVIQALHKKAVGFTRQYDVAKYSKDQGAYTLSLEEEIQPDTNAIKYWLSNRDPARWSERRHIQVTGKHGAPDVGIKSETKMELMSSILSLIIPKPDKVPENNDG